MKGSQYRENSLCLVSGIEPITFIYYPCSGMAKLCEHQTLVLVTTSGVRSFIMLYLLFYSCTSQQTLI